MICRYCNYNLDDGDIFKVLSNLEEYKNYSKDEIINAARDYGWSQDNPKHFSKIHIIQFPNKPQIEVCPECSGIWPVNNNMPKEFHNNKIKINKEI